MLSKIKGLLLQHKKKLSGLRRIQHGHILCKITVNYNATISSVSEAMWPIIWEGKNNVCKNRWKRHRIYIQVEVGWINGNTIWNLLAGYLWRKKSADPDASNRCLWNKIWRFHGRPHEGPDIHLVKWNCDWNVATEVTCITKDNNMFHDTNKQRISMLAYSSVSGTNQLPP